MALAKMFTFQNCASSVEPITNPATGKVEGQAFVIIDQDTGDVYRYPMPLDSAKIVGQRLMGIGDMELVNGAKADQVIKAAVEAQSRGRRR